MPGYLRGPFVILKRISPLTRYKLRKLLLYALVTAAVGLVLMLFSGHVGLIPALGWGLVGIWTGVLEEFLFGRRFRSLAIPLQFIGKAVAVNAFTIAIVLLALATDLGHSLPYGMEARFATGTHFTDTNLIRTALQVVVVTSVAILIVQVEEFMGRRFFMGFLLGWYDKPRESERVVLSIDLVSSSALNERLGDMLYFRFLNFTHSLMTEAVLRHDAEIHKYVGDEVIFTWTMREGLHNFNCLALYFDIRGRLEAHRHEMMREFGAFPQFRGGLHGGRVITAQVGHIKRAIDLSGDVMNTTSRVESLAKTLKVDLLITQELLDRMPDAHLNYSFGEEVEIQVKGGKRRLTVRTVEQRPRRSAAAKGL